mmetsp:Transcript_40836/g.65958  ORF Transcript_40836/g.65958 Transcript_40836/m.65958 type:complete len:243 (-) Transcript_40836:4-732(-)
MVPVILSSVAPRGSSTKGVRLFNTSNSSLAMYLTWTSSLMTLLSVGEELYLQPLTMGMSGSNRTMPRTAVDLPTPLSPEIITPPMAGSTRFRSSASFTSSWPTTAEKGKAFAKSASSSMSPSALASASARRTTHLPPAFRGPLVEPHRREFATARPTAVAMAAICAVDDQKPCEEAPSPSTVAANGEACCRCAAPGDTPAAAPVAGTNGAKKARSCLALHIPHPLALRKRRLLGMWKFEPEA